jgi:hypothetical protein
MILFSYCRRLGIFIIFCPSYKIRAINEASPSNVSRDIDISVSRLVEAGKGMGGP